MARSIDAAKLAELIKTTPNLIVLDVTIPERYEAGHLPGALNACVHEVAFADTVAGLTPDKGRPIAVYDTSGRSRAGTLAAGKLERDGYGEVYEFTAGVEGWLAAGFPLEPEGARPEEPPAFRDRQYLIDRQRSTITWIGRNLAGRHTGTMAIAEGDLTIARGRLAGGRIVIDMRSIADVDLQEADYRSLLIAHLLSEDFFEVSRYPSAEAQLKGWRAIPGATPGTANYMIEADLTIKGITHGVSFGACIEPQADCIKAQAALDIDRTRWNVTYGSGKLFERLGMHLVNDLVTLEFFLVAV